MAQLSEVTAVKMDGKDVSLEEVLRTLKVAGNVEFLNDAVADLLVTRAANAEGITVSDDELQEAADALRQANRLSSAEETQQWLKNCGLSVEEFEQRLEFGVVTRKLFEKVTTDGRVEQHFAENRRSYDAVCLSHIVVNDEGRAQELRAQLAEEGADFAELARSHSIDEASKSSGGELGVVNRTELSPAVESAVFAGNDGDVVGPIKTDQGYHVLKVQEILLGKLSDEEIVATIRQELYAEWLDDQAKSANVEIVLHDAI